MTRNAALIHDWLEWLKSGNLSPATIRNRKYTIGAYAAGVDLTKATTADVLAHLQSLTGSAWQRAGHLAAIKSFHHWCHATGNCETNPAAIVRSIRTHERSRPLLPGGVLDRALLLSDDRTRFALLLGAYAGLRREEIATFHSSCVRGDVLVIVGKGSKERRIPMHPRLRPFCDELRAHPGWAFPSHVKPGEHVTPETIQRMVTKALGEPWRTHDLRRLAATRWYDATHDLRAVQELLGHADPVTTSRYVRPNDDAMRTAVLAVA